MSILTDTGVDCALDLSGRDLIDAWRVARDYADPSVYAEVHRILASAAESDAARDANAQWIRIYDYAAGIVRRQRAVFTEPVQGCAERPAWPVCGVCGADNASWRVFCCAEAGGEILACDECSNYGDPMGSPAIEQVETSAIHRSSKVRVDELAPQDVEVAA